MATLQLPEPVGIKPLEIDAHSIYLRWAILSSHGLSTEQLKSLIFEFKTTDGKLRGECNDNNNLHEYKARLYGLSSDTKYRFQMRSKLLQRETGDILYSKWSNRIEIETGPDQLVIISNEKELDMASIKHRLKNYMNENRKLKLQIEQLQSQLNDKSVSSKGHWTWDSKKIVAWIMRIQDGLLKEYKKPLLKHLKAEGITGKDLCLINENNLKSWGVTTFQHRKVLMHYIQQLTENDEKPSFEYNPHIANLEDEEQKEECSEPPKIDEIKEEEQQQQEEEEEEEEQQQQQQQQQQQVPSIGITKSVQDLLESTPPKQKSWSYKEGMLSVTVVKARNVDNLDPDEGPEGASDPYVELELKGNYKNEKTKSIQNESNPEWNEKFQLFVDDAKQDVLKCRLYDHDKWTMDDKIGEVHVPVITVLGANGYLMKEYDVIGSKNDCKLTLALKYWESRA